MRRVQGDLALEQAGIQAFRDFFPSDLHQMLERSAMRQPERKRVLNIDPGESFPEPVATAADIVGQEFGFPGINTAILKRYGIDEPSAAFDLHYDPEELQGGLVLASLSSLATLTVVSMNAGWVRHIDCYPNSLIIMPPGFLHSVTPPVAERGPRSFMFLGHRCPHVLNNSVEITAVHYH